MIEKTVIKVGNHTFIYLWFLRACVYRSIDFVWFSARATCDRVRVCCESRRQWGRQGERTVPGLLRVIVAARRCGYACCGERGIAFTTPLFKQATRYGRRACGMLFIMLSSCSRQSLGKALFVPKGLLCLYIPIFVREAQNQLVASKCTRIITFNGKNTE